MLKAFRMLAILAASAIPDDNISSKPGSGGVTPLLNHRSTHIPITFCKPNLKSIWPKLCKNAQPLLPRAPRRTCAQRGIPVYCRQERLRLSCAEPRAATEGCQGFGPAMRALTSAQDGGQGHLIGLHLLRLHGTCTEKGTSVGNFASPPLKKRGGRGFRCV